MPLLPRRPAVSRGPPRRPDRTSSPQPAAKRASLSRLNTRVEAVEVDGVETVLTLSDTMPERHGLTFAADGIHSPARAALNPRSRAWFTGQVAWRATVPDAGDLAAEAHVFMGPGRHLVRYPLRQSRLVNIVAVEERDAWGPEGLAPYRRSRQPAPRLQPISAPRAARPARPGGNPSISGASSGHPVATVWDARAASRFLGDAAQPDAALPRPGREHGAGGCLEPRGRTGQRTPTPPTALATYAELRRPRNGPHTCRRPRPTPRINHLRPGPWRFAAHSAASPRSARRAPSRDGPVRLGLHWP